MVKINSYLTLINYTPVKNKKIEHIVIHFTANNGDTAKNNCIYFHDVYRGASANDFVDEKEIWQCVKHEDSAWHTGAKYYYTDCRNWNSIGIELCSRKDKNGKYYFKEKTINNAIELTAYLMIKYNLPISKIDKVLIRHWDNTGKLCPRPFIQENEEAWREFKRKVVEEIMIQKLISKYSEDTVEKALSRLIETYVDDTEPSGWAVKEIEEAKELGLTDGSRPQMFTTRQETAIMCLRTYKKIKEEK